MKIKLNFQKIGSGESVKRKIKKLWPYMKIHDPGLFHLLMQKSYSKFILTLKTIC